METHLADEIRNTPLGREADAILRSCVHCGFCNATCPTYQLLGDELDGPRGRIYQIKEVLEGATATRSTQVHLDRCLTCMGCETTCPSGVQYGRLLDIGREFVDQRVTRPWRERWTRALLRAGLSRPTFFAAVLGAGRLVRPWLPSVLRDKILPRRHPGARPRQAHARRVLFLTSCTQEALLPSIDRAAMRVLDALAVEVRVEARSGCCGALRAHLSDAGGALVAARRNVDAWTPHLDEGVEGIVMTASGCGVRVRDYGRLLADDPHYAARAARVSALTTDLAEWIQPSIGQLRDRHALPETRRIAFHPPCTLQHGQSLSGVVEQILTALGAELVPVRDRHLCCGSAGAYSLIEPTLSRALRDRKLDALQATDPEMILSANIGCLAHLEAGATRPVRHWIEWVDSLLLDPATSAVAVERPP